MVSSCMQVLESHFVEWYVPISYIKLSLAGPVSAEDGFLLESAAGTDISVSLNKKGTFYVTADGMSEASKVLQSDIETCIGVMQDPYRVWCLTQTTGTHSGNFSFGSQSIPPTGGEIRNGTVFSKTGRNRLTRHRIKFKCSARRCAKLAARHRSRGIRWRAG